MEIVMFKGLPASGKTTCYKNEYRDKDYLRVSAKDIAKNYPSSLDGKKVTILRNTAIREAINQGFNVVVDDYNLDPLLEKNLRIFAKKLGVDFRVDDRFLDVPVEECYLNDLKREDSVGMLEINKYYHQYLCPSVFDEMDANWEKRRALLICVDNVLQKKVSRGINIEVNTPDPLITTIIDSISSEMDYYCDIVLVSTKPESERANLKKWLDRYMISYVELFMNEDEVLPKEMAKALIFNEKIRQKWAILGVIDSDFRSCEMWRRNGLQVLEMGDRYNG